VALSSLQLIVRCHNQGDVCCTAQVCSGLFIMNAHIHRPKETIFILVYDKYKINLTVLMKINKTSPKLNSEIINYYFLTESIKF